VEAKIKGYMVFEDSLIICRFHAGSQLELLCSAVDSATGWDINSEEAMRIGRRAVNLARVFNLKAGIGPELDAPSVRYGSTPIDGPALGKGIMPHWDQMLSNYYKLMGWNAKGKPLPMTLEKLGIDVDIAD
jgi:aldehyde:ferredoxin oxidoreductase